MSEVNGYNLSRAWFDFTFENPDNIKVAHTALYFYIIDSWNRYGQKEKFGLPTYRTMEALSIKSKNTYYGVLNDLIKFGFVKLIQKSKNQNTSNIISISATSSGESASKSALDLANIQHVSQREDSEGVSTVPIDKQVNKEQDKYSFEDFWKHYHDITGLLKTDKESAKKYWNGLPKKEKETAYEKVEEYWDSLNDKKYARKARTYLDTKTFNDEFTVAPIKKPLTMVKKTDHSGVARYIFKDENGTRYTENHVILNKETNKYYLNPDAV